MRIVHISDCYLPRLGGIEIQVQGLAEQQVQRGHDVHVITATRPWPHQEASSSGLVVHRIVARIPFDFPIHPKAKSLIANRVAALKPDVVHIHMGAISPFAWSGIAACHQLGIPSLTTVHSIWAPWTRWMYRLLKLVNGWHRKTQLAAVSRAAADLVAETTSRGILLTPNGVDLKLWADGLETREPHAPIALVCATRFAPRKRVMQLLALINKLNTEFADDCPRLTIAGNGPQFIAAQQYVARHHLENVVHLVGRLDRAGLKEMFEQGDAFIQLSELESFGIAAIEARAVGLPVLGRSGNGFSEFVQHGVTGFLENDDAGIAARLVEMVQNPQLIRQLKQQSAATPPVQNWDYAIKAVMTCYDHVLSNLR